MVSDVMMERMTSPRVKEAVAAGAGLDYLDALAMHHVNQYRQGRMLIKL